MTVEILSVAYALWSESPLPNYFVEKWVGLLFLLMLSAFVLASRLSRASAILAGVLTVSFVGLVNWPFTRSGDYIGRLSIALQLPPIVFALCLGALYRLRKAAV